MAAKQASKKTSSKVVAKKPPVKKTPAKKTTPQRVAVQKSEMKSFKVAKDQQPFKSFKITRQTVYWVILVSFIIFAQLWILKLQVEVATLLNAQQAQIEEL